MRYLIFFILAPLAYAANAQFDSQIGANALARQDAELELSNYNGGSTPFTGHVMIDLVQLLDDDEGTVNYEAVNSNGVIKQLGSGSMQWAHNTAGTGNAVYRIHANYCGGDADNVDFRLFGHDGLQLFGTSETTGPGNNVLGVNGDISITGTYYGTSDERLKDIKCGYWRGLESILFINPKRFYWNSTSGVEPKQRARLNVSPTAQNISPLVPEAISSDEKGYMEVSDRVLISTLINGEKELAVLFIAVLVLAVRANFKNKSLITKNH